MKNQRPRRSYAASDAILRQMFGGGNLKKGGKKYQIPKGKEEKVMEIKKVIAAVLSAAMLVGTGV